MKIPFTYLYYDPIERNYRVLPNDETFVSN